MPMNLVCQKCRGVLPLPDDFAGEVVRCGNCGGLIPIPKISAPAPAPKAPTSPAPIPTGVDFSESSPTPQYRKANGADGTKSIIILIWGGVAAMTIGTIVFVGWLLSQPKQEIVIVEPPPTKSSTVTQPKVSTVIAPKPNDTPTTTPSTSTPGQLLAQAFRLPPMQSATFTRKNWFWAIETVRPTMLMKYSSVTFEKLAQIPLPDYAVQIAADPAGASLFVALKSGPIIEFDIDSADVDGMTVHVKETRRHNVSGTTPIRSMVDFSSHGSRSLAWLDTTNVVSFVDFTNPAQPQSRSFAPESKDEIESIAVTADGLNLAVLSKPDAAGVSHVFFVNPQTAQSVWKMSFGSPAPARSITGTLGSDVITLNASNEGPGRLAICGVQKKSGRSSSLTVPAGSMVKSSSTGNLVAVASLTGGLELYDVTKWLADEKRASPLLLAKIADHPTNITTGLTIAPNGKTIVLHNGALFTVGLPNETAIAITPPSMNVATTVPNPSPTPTPTPTPSPSPTKTAIPKASDLSRCVFYLPFDGPTPEDAFVDVVNKRKVGRGAAPNFQYVDGARGKAMQIKFTAKDRGSYDISDQASKLDFRLGQAYTLAYWVRFPEPIKDQTIAFGMIGKGDTRLVTGLPDTTGSIFALEFIHSSSKTRKEYVKITAPFKDGPTAWNHFALTRNGDGKINGYFNGEAMTGENKTLGDIVDFSLAGFGISMAGKGGTVEIDELALFQRILPPDDIRKLMGLGKE